MTDTKLLKDIIREKGIKYKYIATMLGLSTYGLQKKIENDSQFKATEIIKLSEILSLDNDVRDNIFFASV